MSNITKIKISGTSYSIKDENACNVVELTQAEYDALPSTAKTSNSLFIITDAQGADLSQYYTSAQTESAITQAVSGKQDTLSAGTGIEISGNVISATGGGGKAIEAGRGISVTTGETADTVSLNLSISAGTGTASIQEGNSTTASGQYSHAEGNGTQATGNCAHSEGYWARAYASYSHAEGYSTTANGSYSHAEGYTTKTTNDVEHASGKFNVSNKVNNTFGDSGNTLFSVGNGTGDNARHNAFEIRQNGDIYITSGGTDIKLQDNLGGGGGTSYTAGTGIDITNDVISVTGKQDTLISGTNIKTINNESLLGSGNIVIQGGGTISIDQTVISGSTNAVSGGAVYSQLGGMKIVKLTESEYTALVTKDDDTLYCVVPDPSN